jgi:hypothetical protein
MQFEPFDRIRQAFHPAAAQVLVEPYVDLPHSKDSHLFRLIACL